MENAEGQASNKTKPQAMAYHYKGQVRSVWWPARDTEPHATGMHRESSVLEEMSGSFSLGPTAGGSVTLLSRLSKEGKLELVEATKR